MPKWAANIPQFTLAIIILLSLLGWQGSIASTTEITCLPDNTYQQKVLPSLNSNSEPDWLILLANSILQFHPDPSSWDWNWGEGVLMYGLWQAYEATGNLAYYLYVKDYIDHYVPQNGNITVHIDPIAYANKISPAILLPLLYQKTSDQHYLTAAQIVADYIQNTVLRVSNGALAHIFEDELWIDTLFMTSIFLMYYAEVSGNMTYIDEAVNQMLWHKEYIFDDASNLFYHGWDEDGSAIWANPVTHQSACFWGRGNGWAVVVLSELLDYVPLDHVNRTALEGLYSDLINKLLSLQDPATGLWYTVVDQGGASGNYLETSASAMYVYGIEKGILNGWLPFDHSVYSQLGNDGLNERVYIQSQNSEVIIHSISGGTTIGDYNYYVNVPLGNNRVWGLGAYLMAKTFFRSSVHKPKPVDELEISIDGNNPSVQWQPVTLDVYDYPVNISHYRLYHASCPEFDCVSSDSTDILNNNLFIDTNIELSGYSYQAQFYKICAIDDQGKKSDPSEVFGFIRYPLSTTSSTNFNLIALPFHQTDISNAATLIEAVPACNSAAYWSAEYQGYSQYVDEVHSTNFDVMTHGVYFINVVADTFYIMYGQYDLPVYSLLAVGESTHFNTITLPFDKQDIENASDLLVDINDCNSVAKWDVTIQGYIQYDPSAPETDFTIYPGYGYLVYVTDNSVWPTPLLNSNKSVHQSPKQPVLVDKCSSAPHLIIWRVQDSQHEFQPVELAAFIGSRPDEILTADSPGCDIFESGWVIQCASLPSGWREGEIVTIQAIDRNNNVKYYEAALSWNPSDKAALLYPEEPDHQPYITQLYANYPNPFNSTTRIPYEIAASGPVDIRIMDITGRLVRTLLKREMFAGKHEINWSGMDDQGHSVASGVYLIELSASEQIFKQKILLVR
ncbi:glycoside hydrolase family 88 protein [candidate division KSB1 bacterium]|nr:glycoside hydrolase family 88 protein [candidate division KSB1 bacterium]